MEHVKSAQPSKEDHQMAMIVSSLNAMKNKSLSQMELVKHVHLTWSQVQLSKHVLLLHVKEIREDYQTVEYVSFVLIIH